MTDPAGPSLQECFRATMDPSSNTVALTFGERDHSWGELARYGQGVVEAMDAAGVPARTAVAIVARNHPTAVAALLALLVRTHRLVLIDPLQRADRLADSLAALDVDAIVVAAQDYGDLVRHSADKTGAAVVTIGDIDAGAEVARPVTRAVVALADAEIGVEIATSGTTGTPKRIVYSYASCLATGRDACIATASMLPDGYTGTDWPVIQIFPIAHVGGLYYILQLGYGGQHQVLLEKFAVAEWAAAVGRFHPPLLWVHPPGIRMILAADIPAATLSGAVGLRTGSAPLEAETRRAFTEKYGIPIIGYFGATEYCGIVTDWSYQDTQRFQAERPLSVGRARPGIELRITDLADDERDCVPGETGRLHIKVARIAASWFRTNDLARLDNEGFLTLEGRADSVINRGGFKVSCLHVAEVLRGHPGVGDVLVVGIADSRLGEVPAAAIEVRAGMDLSIEQIADYARQKLLSYEVPARFLVSRSLPRAGLSKISQGDVLKLLEAS